MFTVCMCRSRCSRTSFTHALGCSKFPDSQHVADRGINGVSHDI